MPSPQITTYDLPCIYWQNYLKSCLYWLLFTTPQAIAFWHLLQLYYWNCTRQSLWWPLNLNFINFILFHNPHCPATVVITNCPLFLGFYHTTFPALLPTPGTLDLGFISWFLFLRPVFCYEMFYVYKRVYVYPQYNLTNRTSIFKTLWLSLPDYIFLFAPQIPKWWLLFCFLRSFTTPI